MLADFNLQSLIALIPIVTLAYAFIHDHVQAKHSELKIAPLSCQTDRIHIIASNIGNSAAIITAAKFFTGELSPKPLNIVLPLEQTVIEGGDSRTMELKVDMTASPGGLVPYELRNTPNCTVKIVIDTVAFGDELTYPKEVKCACPV